MRPIPTEEFITMAVVLVLAMASLLIDHKKKQEFERNQRIAEKSMKRYWEGEGEWE